MIPQCCLMVNTIGCQNIAEWDIQFLDRGKLSHIHVCNDHLHEVMKQLRLKGYKPKARLREILEEKVMFT